MNPIRIVSGFLLGLAVSDLLALLLSESWTLFLGGILVVALYMGTILTILKVTGAWRKVLAEHFPEVWIRTPQEEPLVAVDSK